MAIKLHEAGVAYAKKLIQAGEVMHDEAHAWQEDKPTRDEYVRFVNAHSMQEYGQWFLAVDTDKPATAMEHYLMPHGDLSLVHRCALLETQKEAQKGGYTDIEHACKELLAKVIKK